MRWFLDMCFIVYYASETNNPLEDKVKILVKNKKENYLVCKKKLYMEQFWGMVAYTYAHLIHYTHYD